MDAAVRSRGLAVAYGARTALAGIDLDLPAGALTALIGPNGSGKSTLLSAIAGLVRPVAGTLERLGQAGQVARQRVAYVLQATPENAVLPLTVGEVVAMGRFAARGLLRRFTGADRAAVADALERMELTDLRRRQLRELSGGQRQRVLVAQGLAQEAELLLLDEPVTGLDLVSRQRILDAIDAERAAGRTVVLATHDLRDARVADHVVLLATRVVAAGPPDAVLREESLREAYGGRLVRLSGSAALDDEHHHHVAGDVIHHDHGPDDHDA